jgi:hypothetical protein
MESKSRRKELGFAQTGLRLPREMLERLKKDDLSVSEGIRIRLERTFEEDALDPPTRKLAAALIRIAEEVEREVGHQWHSSPVAHEAFTAAIMQRLDALKPSALTGAAHDLFLKSIDDPGTIGRSIERRRRRVEQANEQTKAELLAKFKGGKK